MKFYIAAPFEEKDLVSRCAKILFDKGHEVYRWDEHKPVRPYEDNSSLVTEYSIDNIDAIINSDVFIFINNTKNRNGCVELGAAILSYVTNRKPKIYVVGKIDIMYFFHPSITLVDNVEQALTFSVREI